MSAGLYVSGEWEREKVNLSEGQGDESACVPKRHTWRVSLRQHLHEAQRLELRFVCAQRHLSGRGLLNVVAVTTNWLGNGWLYLFLAAALLVGASQRAYSVLMGAGLAVAAAHAVYPWIKRKIARLRPFEQLPQLRPRTPVMDRYSFPSGHCMTVTAVSIPFAQGYPELTWWAVSVCLLVAWARIACAHHYPSDLLAGCALGAVMAFGSAAVMQTAQML